MEGNWASSSAENEKHKTHWSDDETRALLKVWEDHLSDLRKTKRNLKIYVAIAECLRAQGVEKSVKEIKSKMENLGNRYREVRRTHNVHAYHVSPLVRPWHTQRSTLLVDNRLKGANVA
ncbi:hypothetical protein HPB49_019209 [Dermacentor silvarum]|uniref:Uncharacterized protein n=1 Tax=Dermacentor silvarum TaxID=543639 RepID=A0ACB8CGT8_DERSI|nr:hypothetical protein HPB49_019209 [Dermacentor silvarum]